MPPKKNVKNAFYFYMVYIRKELEREGRIYPGGFADVINDAYPRWQNLPAAEKVRYEQMAKDYKARMRGQKGEDQRLDNLGNLIANRVDPEEELKQINAKEKHEIITMLQSADPKAMNFYLIDFMTLCKTQEGIYLLAEVALVEYSLLKGITRRFQRFIDPGRIPTGYRFDCLDTSSKTHKIPIENFDQAEKNYQLLWNEMKEFTNPRGRHEQQPPLFCMGWDRERIQACLDCLGDLVGVEAGLCYSRVFSLERLVGQLYQIRILEPRSEPQIIASLQSSSWDVSPNTRCDWHEELEDSHCALAVIQRYCYAMSDMLSIVYNITLTPQHLPARPLDNGITVFKPAPSRTAAPLKNMRSKSNSYSRQVSSSRSSVCSDVPSYEIHDEDEEDEDFIVEKPTLRRPNAMARTQTLNMVSSGDVDFPALGGAVPSLPAAPHASEAPPPPSAWKTAGIQGPGPAPLQGGRGLMLGLGRSQQAVQGWSGQHTSVRPPVPPGLGQGVSLAGEWNSLFATVNTRGRGRGVMAAAEVQLQPVGRGSLLRSMQADQQVMNISHGLENLPLSSQ